MWVGARVWSCIALIAALVGCGGGGGGGGGDSGTLHVSVSIGADLYLFRPGSVRASITGLEGHAPNCTLKSGRLPAGVSLNGDCSITGTPTEMGAFQFIVDFSASNVANHLDVYAGVTVFGPTTIYSLPSNRIVVGEAADWPTLNNFWTRTAQDTVTYGVDEGTLPPGLILDPSTGRIHGVATTEGSYRPRIGVTVSSPVGTTHLTSETPLMINVGGFDLHYESSGEVGGFAGFPMRATVTGLQPGATYAFAWDDSQPPPAGIELDPATGALSGTPRALANGATYRVLVTARNQGQEVSGSLIARFDVSSPVYIRHDCNGKVGAPVHCAPIFYANGGLNIDGASYRFTLTEGYLPGTFTLDPNTGVLAGTWDAYFSQVERLTVTVMLNGVSFDIPAIAQLTLSY